MTCLSIMCLSIEVDHPVIRVWPGQSPIKQFRSDMTSREGCRITSRVMGVMLCLTVWALMAPDNSAYAQAEDDPFAGIEEMLVIGNSSGAILQSQEVSVVGFDADYLEALGASDLSDIATFTPNLEIRTPFAASNPVLFIRGVGLRDFNANSSSSVAVYNDDIYMNSPAGQLAQLFDVANVDVLRGPQGGIYGRNAAAGAIRVISRKPTGETGGSVNVTYGRFEQIELEGAAEAPLVPGIVSMRMAGKMSRRGGHTKNRCGDVNYSNPVPGANAQTNFDQRVHEQCFNPSSTSGVRFGGDGFIVGQRPGVKERVNDINNWAARTLLRFEFDVADGLEWLLNFHGGQNLGDARQFQMMGATQDQRDVQPRIETRIDTQDLSNYTDPDNQRPDPPGTNNLNALIFSPFIGDPFEGDYNNVGKERLDLFGTSLIGDLTINDWKLKSITGYEWNQRDVDLNLDGNPYPALEPELSNDSYQVTQELRLSWDDGGPIDFQIAGMFLYEALDVDNLFPLAPSDLRTQSYTMFTRYGAIYTDIAWDPSESFSVRAEGRLNYENKEIEIYSESAQTNRRPPIINFSGTEKSQADEYGFAGGITMSYLPTEDVTFYIKYAHGWKGPHINGLVLSPNSANAGGGVQESLTTPVKPEQVDSIEGGIKSVWWDARFTANGAIFYYDYNDIQVFRLRNTGGGVPVNQLINAKDADILGVELDFDLTPFDGIGHPIFSGINLFASFAWLDSSYTDFVNQIQSSTPSIPPQVVTTTLDFSGSQLVNSPEYSFVGFARWVMPLSDYGVIVPRLDWSFKDDIFFSPANSEYLGQSALWLFNLRLTYKVPSENFEIAGWIENLTDQSYAVDVFNLARFRNSILYAIGDPRTYGISMKVTF
jgi:iron complex outermembrane recepter protein